MTDEEFVILANDTLNAVIDYLRECPEQGLEIDQAAVDLIENATFEIAP